MYIQIWKKYLPVIKILLKRAVVTEQSLSMNSSDFQKSLTTKKTGYSFFINFQKGRVNKITATAGPARDLASMLLSDEAVKELLGRQDFLINMDAKFKLNIKCIPREQEPELVKTDDDAKQV